MTIEERARKLIEGWGVVFCEQDIDYIVKTLQAERDDMREMAAEVADGAFHELWIAPKIRNLK